MAGHFEAKKHGYRQTQDGVVVSFVLHPNDLDAAFAVAALGTRYIIAFEELGDDDKPVSPVAQRSEPAAHNGSVAGSNPAGTTKQRKPFNSLSLSQRAGIRCGDAQFAMFLMDEFPETASKYHDTADVVRQLCGVTSRAELNTNFDAAQEWDHLEMKYQQWFADKRYQDSYR